MSRIDALGMHVLVGATDPSPRVLPWFPESEGTFSIKSRVNAEEKQFDTFGKGFIHYLENLEQNECSAKKLTGILVNAIKAACKKKEGKMGFEFNIDNMVPGDIVTITPQQSGGNNVATITINRVKEGKQYTFVWDGRKAACYCKDTPDPSSGQGACAEINNNLPLGTIITAPGSPNDIIQAGPPKTAWNAFQESYNLNSPWETAGNYLQDLFNIAAKNPSVALKLRTPPDKLAAAKSHTYLYNMAILTQLRLSSQNNTLDDLARKLGGDIAPPVSTTPRPAVEAATPVAAPALAPPPANYINAYRLARIATAPSLADPQEVTIPRKPLEVRMPQNPGTPEEQAVLAELEQEIGIIVDHLRNVQEGPAFATPEWLEWIGGYILSFFVNRTDEMTGEELSAVFSRGIARALSKFPNWQGTLKKVLETQRLPYTILQPFPKEYNDVLGKVLGQNASDAPTALATLPGENVLIPMKTVFILTELTKSAVGKQILASSGKLPPDISETDQTFLQEALLQPQFEATQTSVAEGISKFFAALTADDQKVLQWIVSHQEKMTAETMRETLIGNAGPTYEYFADPSTVTRIKHAPTVASFARQEKTLGRIEVLARLQSLALTPGGQKTIMKLSSHFKEGTPAAEDLQKEIQEKDLVMLAAAFPSAPANITVSSAPDIILDGLTMTEKDVIHTIAARLQENQHRIDVAATPARELLAPNGSKLSEQEVAILQRSLQKAVAQGEAEQAENLPVATKESAPRKEEPSQTTGTVQLPGWVQAAIAMGRKISAGIAALGSVLRSGAVEKF